METGRRTGMDRHITDRGQAARGKDILPSVTAHKTQQEMTPIKPVTKVKLKPFEPGDKPRDPWDTDRHHHV